VWGSLRRGADHCREIATATMADVKRAMGL